MLVYGGRNELAYQDKQIVDTTLKPSISLDDIIIFDFKLAKWIPIM